YYQEADDWLSTQFKTGASRNWYGINDSKLNEMLDKQRLILDEKDRKAEVHNIQRYILEEVVNPIPLATYYTRMPVPPYVEGYHPHASYGLLHMKDIWLNQ